MCSIRPAKEQNDIAPILFVRVQIKNRLNDHKMYNLWQDVHSWMVIRALKLKTAFHTITKHKRPLCFCPRAYLHLTSEVSPVQQVHTTDHQLHLALFHQPKRRLKNGSLAFFSCPLYTFCCCFWLPLCRLCCVLLSCRLGFFRTFLCTVFLLFFLCRLT